MKPLLLLILFVSVSLYHCTKDETPTKPDDPTLNGDTTVQADTTPPDPTKTPAGMKPITGGTFQMGSNNGDTDEQPVHTVTVSSFYMDSTEVTQADYQTLLGVNPSMYMNNNGAVSCCSWCDAVLYCNARSKRNGKDTVYYYTSIIGTTGIHCRLNDIVIDLSKNGYRLATEAEWEYACRAGTTTEYYWGDDSLNADSYAWCYENPTIMTHDVALKLPNSFGLYDMSGNVSEWCNDYWDPFYYSSSPSSDPTGPTSGQHCVVRGGSRFSSAYGIRSAFRDNGTTGTWTVHVGFRCVLPSKN
jgi:formylglycine-generating enzyme required for sulfatase activity